MNRFIIIENTLLLCYLQLTQAGGFRRYKGVCNKHRNPCQNGGEY